MPAVVPFLLGQQGTGQSAARNRYVTNENTRDESLDPIKYPLHRLSREETSQSTRARHVLAERDRVRRLFPNSGAR
jgi:hypothetical protein